MSNKSKRASALFSLLSLCLVGTTFSTDSSAFQNKTRVHQPQDGRNPMSKSKARVDEILDVSVPKEYIRNMSNAASDKHDFEDNDAAGMEDCTWTAELRQQKKSAGTSEWFVNATTLEILDNDPQILIDCTQPGDTITFSLSGAHKFKQTLVVDHDLDLSVDSWTPLGIYNDLRDVATFTCPNNGPFLSVKSCGFNFTGFVVQHCAYSSGDGSIVIGSDSKVMFERNRFINNTNRAIYVASNTSLALQSCHFEENSVGSKDNGGAIRVQKQVSLSISTSLFHGNTAGYGGAIDVDDNCTLIISSSNFSNNTAQTYGGAMQLASHIVVTIQNSTLLGNTAEEYGGAMRLASDNIVTIQNSTLMGNTVAFYGGGAISIRNSSNVAIVNTLLSENEIYTYGYGAAIMLAYHNNLTIMNSTFSGNTVKREGGAINVYAYNQIAVINTWLFGNNAKKGGAIFLLNNNDLAIENTMLLGNHALEDGGAIDLVKNNNVTITNTTLSGNHALKYGGAINVNKNNTLTIMDTTLSWHNGSSRGGAINVKDDCNFTMVNSELFENKASEDGGAMSFSDRIIVDILNSSLKQNQATWHGGALRIGSDSFINISFSSMIDNYAKWGGGVYLETNNDAVIAKSNFRNNSASMGGIIYGGRGCDVSIDQSKGMENYAESGGCLYGVSLSTRVKDSSFLDNFSFQLGGCFYIDSSTAAFEGNTLSFNDGLKGGAIYASSGSLIHFSKNLITSNSAHYGGGIALMSDSRIIVLSCTFLNNTSYGGGGMYIESNMQQTIVAQFKDSRFRRNRASRYGGAIAIKTFASRSYECTNIVEPCSRVFLLTTSFIGNTARQSGAAILATKLDNILVACTRLYGRFNYSEFLQVEDIRYWQKPGYLETLRGPGAQCHSWKGNRLIGETYGSVVGTFGQTIDLTTNSTSGSQIRGNSISGFILYNVKSAKQFPVLLIKTKDAFGNSSAPTLYEKDALVLNSSSKRVLKDSIGLSFENGMCTISSISSSAPKGNYTIDITPKDEDILAPTKLTISISDCGINEELTLDESSCEECRNGFYNFDPTMVEGCSICPKHASCDGIFLVIEEGYWQRSPCHDKVKKCIIDKACDYPNRTNAINDFITNHIECDFNKSELEEYGEIQCHKGYKGPLCGSCKKSYGVSSNSECSKCGNSIIVVLRFIGAVAYLLVGTIITIKGVLPSKSTTQTDEDVETTLLATACASSMNIASSSQLGGENENGGTNVSLPLDEGDVNSLSSPVNQPDGVEVIKLKLVSSLKISLNYFQVTSTAAGMDVEWTKKILDLLKGLNILGAATNESISYSFDCLFSATSNDSKAIWRLLFSLFVPVMVISLLSLHWAHRSMTKHGGDGFYFLRRLLLTVVTVTYATYFDLTRVAMRTFSCVMVYTNIDPFSKIETRYWIGDTSIECYKNTHIVLIFISLVIVGVVTISFPLFTSFTLDRHKAEVRNMNSWTHDTLGFLGGPFKQRFIYWECVTMIKKATLSIIIVFSYSLEVQAQGLLILLVLVFFLYIHFLSYPYDEEYHSLNYYESGSLLVSCVTYTLVQFFNIERFSQVARSIISLFTIAINFGFVCLMAYKIIKDLFQLLRALLKAQNIQVPKNMNVISLMRVYSTKRRVRQDVT